LIEIDTTAVAFHSVQSETLRVFVINAKYSALNFTSMKFVVAELRLKRCEVYAISAKLSTRMSPNFVVAKLSSQTLRGLRQVCEALNFNALNFTSVKVAKLSSQTLRKSSSFRTLRKLHELCEAFKSNYTSRCAVHSGLHYDFSYALSASDIASPSPEYRWSQSCLAIFGELRILLLHAFFQLSESSSSFEIRHSNDPNTPRGIHLYFGSSYKHCQHDLADH
jgi:hypothetical protein